MFRGLKKKKHFLLTQISDPLKYCNYALPFPMPIGLPFMPCDLPNEYKLYETDSTYNKISEEQILTFEEQIGLVQRILIPASHRPWQMTAKDYYHNTPYLAMKHLNVCLSPTDRPQVKVYMDSKYIGKVRQTTILNCCCFVQKFQQLQIFDSQDHLIYKVSSRNPQRGHFIILPFCNFNNIKYEIFQITSRSQSTFVEYEEEEHIFEEHLVGEIIHLFNGLAQYTSKNDKYGICLPENADQEHKCLLLHSVLLIDYLLFQNF